MTMHCFRRSTRSVAAIAAGVIGLSFGLAIGEARAAEPGIQFSVARTPGGIAFHYRSDPRTPFAAISFGQRDVYALTTPGKEGLLSLGGALVMQGADGAGQTELIERMKDYAAGASFSFGLFASQGQVRAPAATIGRAMELMAATLKGAKPSQKVLARLKSQAIGSEAQSAVRAETIAQRAALQLALGDHPMTRTFDPDRFERVGLDDIRVWRERMLDRAKLRVVASGRISEADAARMIDKAFADLPERLEPLALKWPELNVPALTVVVEQPTEQSAIVIVGPTTVGTGLEAETASIANAVLGGSNGRLWRTLREALGSTYGAGSGLQAVAPGSRLIRLSGAVANDQVKASLDALKATYADWRGKGITAGELRAVTARVVNDFRSSFDEPARANGQVLALLLANRQVDTLFGYEGRMQGQSLPVVNAFIAEKFPAVERLLTVIVTPSADGLGADCVVRSITEINRCRR